MYPNPISESLREELQNLLLKQDVHLSEFDIFQRLRYFMNEKPELWGPDIPDSISLNDKARITIDMIRDHFDESDLLKYIKIMNSPLVKKMRELEDIIDSK